MPNGSAGGVHKRSAGKHAELSELSLRKDRLKLTMLIDASNESRVAPDLCRQFNVSQRARIHDGLLIISGLDPVGRGDDAVFAQAE